MWCWVNRTCQCPPNLRDKLTSPNLLGEIQNVQCLAVFSLLNSAKFKFNTVPSEKHMCCIMEKYEFLRYHI